jgi:hypothetical protein
MISKELIAALNTVHDLLPDGVSLTKGGVGEIAAAYYLGHTLLKGDKGPDAIDSDGNMYEYKVCETGKCARFNFHMGSRRDATPGWTIEQHVKDKFKNIVGCYCLVRDGMEIIDGEYIPAEDLITLCLKAVQNSTSQQINPNWNITSLRNALNA